MSDLRSNFADAMSNESNTHTGGSGPCGVVFAGHDGRTFSRNVEDADGESDLEQARAAIEAEHGPLPVEPRTDFPSFTVYNAAGEELGGG